MTFSFLRIFFFSVWHGFYFHILGITQIQNDSILQFLPPFSPASLTSCPVLFWPASPLTLSSLGKPWSGHPPKLPLEGDGGNSHRLFIGTSTPRGTLLPYWKVQLQSLAGMSCCNWFIHKSGLSAQREAPPLPWIPLPQPNSSSLSLRRLEDLWLIAGFLSVAKGLADQSRHYFT